MKWALFILVPLTIMLYGCGNTNAPDERMYFSALTNIVTVDGHVEEVPYEIYCYDGGDKYTLAYTLPNTDYNLIGINDTQLCYTTIEGGRIFSVNLESGKKVEYTEILCDYVLSIVPDKNTVYVLCAEEKQLEIYKSTEEKIEKISNLEVLGDDMALGDGGLYYVARDTSDKEMVLKYDTVTGETSIVAENISGDLEYDGGYIYASAENCRRINVSTGEIEFVHKYVGSRAHNGWIYYPSDSRFCENHNDVEIVRRNMETKEIEICGVAHIPSLGWATFKRTVQFGHSGFMVNSMDYQGMSAYMYFEYGDSYGKVISQDID